MTILEAAGSPEEGSNFNPPTLGDFMKSQKISKLKVLRESRAGASVIREAHEFHRKQALKHGIDTPRGLAHMRASRMFSREAGMSLQEKFENGGDELDELPPKAVMKANKAAMMFHKGQAEKAGLDSDVGHAHTAAMEHHMDIMNKAKNMQKQIGQKKPKGPGVAVGPPDSVGNKPQQPQQQQPMQMSKEGGPGSGRRPSGRNIKAFVQRHAGTGKSDREIAQHMSSKFGISYDKALSHVQNKKNYEASPGISGKQSPVPVPQKKDMPNQDVKMPVPSVPLKKLQQGEACGPMMASKRVRNIDRFGEAHSHGMMDDLGYCCDDNPRSVNKQLGKSKIFYGKKPKPMKDNSGLTTKEARRRLQ